jgi:hypothetical protein
MLELRGVNNLLPHIYWPFWYSVSDVTKNRTVAVWQHCSIVSQRMITFLIIMESIICILLKPCALELKLHLFDLLYSTSTTNWKSTTSRHVKMLWICWGLYNQSTANRINWVWVSTCCELVLLQPIADEWIDRVTMLSSRVINIVREVHWIHNFRSGRIWIDQVQPDPAGSGSEPDP